MGKLAGLSCYLCGPIDRVADDGIKIRVEIKAALDSLGIKSLDPTNKPMIGANEVGYEKKYHIKLKEEERWDELAKYAKGIRRVDLRLCDHCDFLVMNLDTDCHMCGSYDEFFEVEDQRKPLFIIAKNGKKDVPMWLFACLPHTHIFNTVEELKVHLTLLDNGTIPLDSKWVIFNK